MAGPGGSGYDSLDAFVAEAIAIERRLVADAVAAGATTIQFDFRSIRTWSIPHGSRGSEVPASTPTGRSRRARRRRRRAGRDPPIVRTALHICRGNYRSSCMCEGSLEPVAERVFGGLPYDAFLVEWDDVGRDGGFDPIRFLRDGAIMVMGIVSTKTPAMEDEDDLLRRMEDAAAFLGELDRLAISAQCGFASVVDGNLIDEATQWRKLELVGRVADRLWGPR